MLDLHSPKWAILSHAYGDAADVPKLIEQLRGSSGADWDAASGNLMSAILHQGDVYTATYAAVPHLLQLAMELGPSKASDELLYSIAYAAGGGCGPEVPTFLEESWDDAQEETRDVILERLISGQASFENAGYLIAGALYLSGECWWGKLVSDWMSGFSIKALCNHCGATTEVFWHNDAPKQSDREYNFYDIDVSPSSEPCMSPDLSMEFESDLMAAQIFGLAKVSGHPSLEHQVRLLFGTVRCQECGDDLLLTSASE